MNIYEGPTEVQMLAAELTGRGKSMHEGPELQTSVRLPYHIGLQVTALARNGGISKNRVFAYLMAVGLEALHDELPADEASRLFDVSEVLQEDSANA